MIELPSNQSKEVPANLVGQSGAASVCESVETATDRSVYYVTLYAVHTHKTLYAGSDHAGGEVANSPGHSSVQPVQDQE